MTKDKRTATWEHVDSFCFGIPIMRESHYDGMNCWACANFITIINFYSS